MGKDTKLETFPTDVRFQNTNCTRYCYVMFVDYNRCTRLFSEGHPSCKYFKKLYEAICPKFWVDRWTDQIEAGIFAYPLPPKREKK